MNAKHSDLIAIANAGLARKLDTAAKKAENKANLQAVQDAVSEAAQPAASPQPEFKQDVWRAVYVLNILRYILACSLLVIVGLINYRPNLVPIDNILHPEMFFVSTLFILASAIVFSYISIRKLLAFNLLIIIQFALDLVLVTFLVHSVGSINSTFTLLFFMVVATGSIVLPRVQALGLAAGAIILMFYEHIYSYLTNELTSGANFGLLVGYALLVFAIAWTISYLAERLRIAELKTYVPGNETIEEFLVREETKALVSALQSTNGNKTEAAKL
ncbi:MAG: hypothetical protein KTR16_08035, partial [Acidiferrobacterales bacterium]|nr:hypothetical protein [Acidiferrobacterales bacterium]